MQWRLAMKQRAEVRRQISMLRRLLERQMELTGQDPISGGKAAEEEEVADRAAHGAVSALAAPAVRDAALPQSPPADGTMVLVTLHHSNVCVQNASQRGVMSVIV